MNPEVGKVSRVMMAIGKLGVARVTTATPAKPVAGGRKEVERQVKIVTVTSCRLVSLTKKQVRFATATVISDTVSGSQTDCKRGVD